MEMLCIDTVLYSSHQSASVTVEHLKCGWYSQEKTDFLKFI